MRPHGISQYSFLVYLPDLHIKLTVTFWASMLLATLPAQCAFVSGFFSSGYDFAIPSSRLNLTIQTLGVATEFVGNYASVLGGLSPQSIDMPVIQALTGQPFRATRSCFYLGLSAAAPFLQAGFEIDSAKYSRPTDCLERSPWTPYFAEHFCSLHPPPAAVATLH